MDGYIHLKEASLRRKRNRFLAEITLDGQVGMAHIPNTGRLGELLFEGNRILVSEHDDAHRKTRFSIRFARKADRWVSIDSQVPNRLVEEALRRGELPEFVSYVTIRREKVFKDSRFDFYLEDEAGNGCYVEVKGVTLVKEGTAMFPDAPTARGIRHLNGLVNAKAEGFRAVVLFVVQAGDAVRFEPNPTDRPFVDALNNAVGNGVECLIYRVVTEPDRMVLGPRMA